MFTRENVFEKRSEFETACYGIIRSSVFKELVTAKTKAEFMQVIFDNFFWIYKFVDEFGLKYDYVDDFHEGFARVRNGDKWGFVDIKFKPICEIKYDYLNDFYDGFACVKIGNKWGIINRKGKEVYEVKYGFDKVMKLLKELKNVHERKCL